MRNPNQVFILALLSLALSPRLAAAEGASAPTKTSAPKSRLNTQIFETENAVESFQDQVKMVRDMAGESQALFKSHPGFFIIEDTDSGARFKNRLLKAQKLNQSLSISYDKDSRVIKDVSEKE